MPPFDYALLRDLKDRRLAIPPGDRSIGPYARAAQRIGQAVTQEELAEVLGISREWYSSLENGRAANPSPEIVTRIALALYGPEAARRMRWKLAESSVAELSEIRRSITRMSAAPSYVDAAIEAIETGSRLLNVTCVSIINLTDAKTPLFGHAIGPQARYWRPLCDRVVRDAHRPLRRGGVGVNEYVPTPEEVAADPSVVLAFDSPDCEREYRYECTIDLWRDFNADLNVRSVIALPLRDQTGYRGTAAFSWTEPRAIELREIELARTLTGVLELLS